MICNYRVTLKGIKGFFRAYHLNPENTLYTFHKQMRSDLEFPQDQPILFKAFDAKGNVVARYALIDLGSGTVDTITIAQVIKNGVTSFEYFYDTASKKSVIVTFEGTEDGSVQLPVIFESKGPVPMEFENGYVAFEDLPQEKRKQHVCNCGDEDCDGDCDDDDDDDDEEEEEEESGSFDEEEIYDEKEGL